MAVWPFLMGFAALLTAWGVWLGSWVAPLLALAGYIGVRMVVEFEPPAKELAIGAVWLLFAFGLCYYKAWLPGLLFCASALTYPIFTVFGGRLEYMGPLAFAADVFGGLALFSIFVGLLGLALGAGPANAGGWRDLSLLSPVSLGVEARTKTASFPDR